MFEDISNQELECQMKTCVRCGLHLTRTNVVVGRGQPSATLWFVGEAPGGDEDIRGIPFVGRAGRLLDMLVKQMGFRGPIYITNGVKCRPPANRNPTEAEVIACRVWLGEQLRRHRPLVVIAMGRFAIGAFKNYTWKQIEKMTVGKEVGHPVRCELVLDPLSPREPDSVHRYLVMPVFHPAYLLRNPDVVQGFISHLKSARYWHNRIAKRPEVLTS